MRTNQDSAFSALSVAASLQLPKGFADEVARAIVQVIAADPEERNRFMKAIGDARQAQAALGIDDPWPAVWVTVSSFAATLQEWEEKARTKGGPKPPLVGVTEKKVWNRLNERSFNGLQNGVHYSQGAEGTAIHLQPAAFIAWWLRGSRRA